jgi:hypothetical protein
MGKLVVYLALIALDAALISGAVLFGMTPFQILLASTIGAAIGFKLQSKHSTFILVLVGIAGGVYIWIGMWLSIFGRIFQYLS